MKIKHHSIFNNLNDSKIDWDSLRNDPTEEHYYLPFKKNEYIKLCDDNKNHKLNKTIFKLLNHINKNRVFSIGSGRACLEYHLSREHNVTVSDLSSSITRLKKFKIFEKVYQMDVFEAIRFIKPDQALILGRIDTELDDKQLELIFKLISEKGNPIIFMPGQKLNLRILIAEIIIRIKSIITGKKLVFCGFSRNLNHFKNLWNKYYTTFQLNGVYLLEVK